MKSAALRLSAAGLACHTGVGGHLSEPDKDKIRKVVEEATRTVLPPVSDLDAYVKLYYADDARVLPPNLETVTGREAIAALRPHPGVRAHHPRPRGAERPGLRPHRLPDHRDATRGRRARRRQGQGCGGLEEAARRELEGRPRHLQLRPRRPRFAAAGPDAPRPRLSATPTRPGQAGGGSGPRGP
jgi:hypothetical protein